MESLIKFHGSSHDQAVKHVRNQIIQRSRGSLMESHRSEYPLPSHMLTYSNIAMENG